VKYNLGISDLRDSNISPLTGIASPIRVTTNSLSIQLNYWFSYTKRNNKNTYSSGRLVYFFDWHFLLYTICLEAYNSILKLRIESLENVSTGLEASTSEDITS
jgi:hypothetical protein